MMLDYDCSQDEFYATYAAQYYPYEDRPICKGVKTHTRSSREGTAKRVGSIWEYHLKEIDGILLENPDDKPRYNSTQHERDRESNFDFRGARYYDSEIGRFLSVDPLAADYVAWSPYNYVLGNPVRFVDPDGRSPVWIPSIDENNKIILTAEEGDDIESLMNFFGGKENAKKYLPESNLPTDFKFREGDKVRFNDDNVFSRTLDYYANNIKRGDDTYDCKELCRQTVLNGAAIENSYTFTGATPSMLKEFGDDWSKKQEVSDLQFGATFSKWGIFSEHAAVNFGKDRSGEEYFFSKNGARGPLVLESKTKLSETYYLWDWQRTDYGKK